MKSIVTIIIMLFCFNTYSQDTLPDTCFTSKQIDDISYTLDSLYHKDSVNEVIIEEQVNLIELLEKQHVLDSLELQYQHTQIVNLYKNEELYKKQIAALRPKWYDNKTVWFIGGIVTTLATGKLIVETVR